MRISENKGARADAAPGPPNFPGYRELAFLAFVLLILTFINGLVPQLQITLLSGQIVVTNSTMNLFVLAVLILGSLMHPQISFRNLPMFTWLLCIGFLLLDMPYLIFVHNMSLTEVLASYDNYYFLLLCGPAALAFRGAVSEKAIVRCIEFLLIVSAVIGIAQYLTAQPILHTQSVDGKFEVASWQFFDQVRAFSLFSSSLAFGLFCSFCGALGVALFRTSPVRGLLLFMLSTIACFATLTRLCYLVFICAITYSLVIIYGKKLTRGIWQPFLFFTLGIATILSGLRNVGDMSAGNLQDTGSLIMRLNEGVYYLDIISHSTLASKLLGSGITYSEQKNPVPIDNVLLAVVLHTGLVGLTLFGILLVKMWLFLRREALRTQRPLVIAATSLWATLPCAGIFNVVIMQLGAVFAICILCKEIHTKGYQPLKAGGFKLFSTSASTHL
ncbi:MAG TPA: hypothetical protein VHX63_02130 [Acidobacteriaceae bacterium]|jgi:hypothetical protein|nr:hypothetical protein [Acidobacteriaceae bacterium]